MTTDLQQAIRDSAEAVGFVAETDTNGVTWIARHDGRSFKGRPIRTGGKRWNPPENAEEDRLLEKYLLDAGWCITKHACDQHHSIEKEFASFPPCHFEFNCPPNEFLTRATAAVWAVKESKK